MSLPALPEPNFIDRDPVAITAAAIAEYEADTGKTLHPAQIERLLVNNIAYRETLVRIGIQQASKQNLLYYAMSPMLEYLAQFYGVERIAAQPAQTVLRFTFPAPVLVDTLIPVGTRVSNGGGTLIFGTAAPVLLAAGDAVADVLSNCESAGLAGNGWAAGEVAVLLDDLGVAGIVVTNRSASAGGAEEEDIERFRQRVADAPESFTTAGSKAAYRWHAMSAHPSIADVAVVSPVAGTVRLYVLSETGLPAGVILDDVAAAVTAETVRPLCDTVQVLAPVEVQFTFVLVLVLYIGADAPTVLAQVEAAVATYAADRRAGLGRDIVLWQIEALAKVSGVYLAHADGLPSGGIVLEPWEWANCTGYVVSLGGWVGG